MTLAELVTEDRVIAEMQSAEHWPSIVELIDFLVASGDLTEPQREPALDALKSREEKSSTGIGGGIAIPHSFLPNLDEVVAVLGRSAAGVDFCAVDHAPVHFIVLFLVPKSQHTLHLKTLASIAKTLNSADTRNRLSAAADAGEIVGILNEHAAA